MDTPAAVAQVADAVSASVQQQAQQAVVEAAVQEGGTRQASRMLASTDFSRLPAHEHTQPFFGTPDPYLTAGKSIAPTAQGLQELGIAAVKGGKVVIPSDLPEGFAAQVQAAVGKGWKLLDFSAIKAETILPGFAPTRGILGAHSANMPAETAESFAAQVEWSAKFLSVVDKLPMAALAYVCIEFFILRPNIDLYQQDIDDDSTGVLAETVAVTAVRMAVFAAVAVVTLGLFG